MNEIKHRAIAAQEAARNAYDEADFHRTWGMMIRAVQWQRAAAMEHADAAHFLSSLLLWSTVEREVI